MMLTATIVRPSEEDKDDGKMRCLLINQTLFCTVTLIYLLATVIQSK